MGRNLWLFFLCTLLYQVSFAQKSTNTNPWSFVTDAEVNRLGQERHITPTIYHTAQLKIDKLKAILEEAPDRFSPEAETKIVILTLPLPEGGFEEFRIQEASIMHPDLQAKYPNIRGGAKRRRK